MLFIKLSAHIWLLNDSVELTDSSLPFMFNTQMEPWSYGGPHWELIEHAEWRKAVKTTIPQDVEANEEINTLYKEYGQAWEKYNQFQQDMADLDWEMERAFHANWYGPNSNLSKKK